MDHSTRQQIAEQIREDIFCGHFSDGQRLGEVELARRFAVGRAPIREALAILSQEGLLEFKANCGVRVSAAVPEPLCDLILPVRRSLELFALRLTVSKLRPRDFVKWQTILDRMNAACQACDVAGAVRSDLAFHRFLILYSEQPDIIGLWRSIVGRLRGRFRQDVLRFGENLVPLYAEHRGLLDLIRAGDVDRAEIELSSHIR